MTLFLSEAFISGYLWWFSVLFWGPFCMHVRSLPEICVYFHLPNISNCMWNTAALLPFLMTRFMKKCQTNRCSNFRKIQLPIVWINKRSQDFLARYIPSNWYSFKLTCVYCKCFCCMKCASPTEAVVFLAMEGNAAFSVLLFGVWSPLK